MPSPPKSSLPKHPGGRPRIIQSPQEMLERGYDFFTKCAASDTPLTVTGLVLALGLSARESLIEYGKRPEFADAVKELKTVCENFCEKRLFANNPVGAIFALKNYGWTDKTEVEHSGRVSLADLVIAANKPADESSD